MTPKFSGKQLIAAQMIAAGEPKQDVAKEVGVQPQTISVWLANEEFELLVNQLQWEMLELARDRLRTLIGDAVATLGNLLGAEYKETTRLKATEMILAHCGLTNPKSGLWGWGVGPATHEELQRKKAMEIFRLDL